MLHFGATLLAQAKGVESLLRSPMVPMLVLGYLFYLIVMRPESKRKAEHAKLVQELKKHDRVVTIGGIHGTVANAAKDSNEITLLIDENSNTKVRVLRTAVSQVVTGKEEK